MADLFVELVLFGIGLLALVLASPNSPAQAQSADLVLCDRVAADPSDPDKPKDVQGARDIAQSDIATAINEKARAGWRLVQVCEPIGVGGSTVSMIAILERPSSV